MPPRTKPIKAVRVVRLVDVRKTIKGQKALTKTQVGKVMDTLKKHSAKAKWNLRF